MSFEAVLGTRDAALWLIGRKPDNVVVCSTNSVSYFSVDLAVQIVMCIKEHRSLAYGLVNQQDGKLRILCLGITAKVVFVPGEKIIRTNREKQGKRRESNIQQ